MSKIKLKLEEQLSDSRSDDIAYRLTVSNPGSSPINLHFLKPRLPDGVDLAEVKDVSFEAAKSKHEKICEDLSTILNDHTFLTSKETQERLLEIEKAFARKILVSLPAIWRVYFWIFTDRISILFNRKKVEQRSLLFEISSIRDAEIANERLFKQDTVGGESHKRMFSAKLDQLREIEASMGEEDAASAIATIEPGSFFATTYVLKYPRSSLNSRKFSFLVEASHSNANSDNHVTTLDSVSVTSVISPNPLILSVIATASALLGVAIQPRNQGQPLSY